MPSSYPQNLPRTLIRGRVSIGEYGAFLSPGSEQLRAELSPQGKSMFAKSRHSRESGNPCPRSVDSRLRGRDAGGRPPVIFIPIRSLALLCKHTLRVCFQSMSSGCQPSEHQMNHRQMNPSLRRFSEGFIVLAQPAALTQPCQGSFDDPSAWHHLELVAVFGRLHYLQDIARSGPHPINQPSPVAPVSPDEPQPRESSLHLVDNQLSAISILDVSGMHHHRQQQPHRIYDDVPLASFYPLASIIATRPPFSVVFTLWLSMMAALGVRSLPSTSRTSGRRVSWTFAHVPSSVHLRKYLYTVCQEGRSCGSIRQAHPVRSTYRLALTTSRRSTVRGLPPGLAGGSNGSKASHWSSVRSEGYGSRLMARVLYLGLTQLDSWR